MKISQALKFLALNGQNLSLGQSYPLTIVSMSDICSVRLVKVEKTKNSLNGIQLFYKTDNMQDFANYKFGSYITLKKYQYIQFLGSSTNIQNKFSKTQYDYFHFQISGDTNVTGSIMSLINFSTNVLYDFQFARLFENCQTILTPPVLPAKHLKVGCYYSMFNGCKKLKYLPILPSYQTKQFCYTSMFQNCESVNGELFLRAPNELQPFCYASMCQNCVNLSGIIIAGNKMTAGSCLQMLQNCQSLKLIDVNFNNWNQAEKSTYQWVKNIPSGAEMFKCPKDLEIEYATDDNYYSYVPESWNIIKK